MTQWSQFPTLSSPLSSALSFSASGIRTWRMLSERYLERNFLNNLVLSLHNWVFTDVRKHLPWNISRSLFPEVDIRGSSVWDLDLIPDRHLVRMLRKFSNYFQYFSLCILCDCQSSTRCFSYLWWSKKSKMEEEATTPMTTILKDDFKFLKM